MMKKQWTRQQFIALSLPKVDEGVGGPWRSYFCFIFLGSHEKSFLQSFLVLALGFRTSLSSGAPGEEREEGVNSTGSGKGGRETASLSSGMGGRNVGGEG